MSIKIVIFATIIIDYSLSFTITKVGTLRFNLKISSFQLYVQACHAIINDLRIYFKLVGIRSYHDRHSKGKSVLSQRTFTARC